VATAVTAFVGRTLKGPVNEPVCINSLAQYAQVFGGQWQSAPLSAAVEQYFEHGGELAVIVRVASGGQAPTIDLPAGEQTLVLVGICPGSREFLRASVDYDGIDPANRTLLRVTMTDAAAADDLFRVLMGEKVEPRRDFIEKHALDVKNLDV
jgi:hypothetical protein